MKVRFSRLAVRELDEILAYISLNNPVAAQRFERRVRGIATRLGQFPESAQAVAERPGVRRIPLLKYPYVIYYKVLAE